MEDFEDDGYEMPCPCEECGEIFDLNDGTSFGNIVYCSTCGDRLNRIKELESEIEDVKDNLTNALHDVDSYSNELKLLHEKLEKLNTVDKD
jgi:predicted  nucleic acid-binding Zn-ribbon protein